MLGKRGSGGSSLVALVLAFVIMRGGAQSCLLTKNFLVSVNDICTGVVVSKHHVLAPSRCVVQLSRNEQKFVRFGVDDLSNPRGGKMIPALPDDCHRESEFRDHMCLLRLTEEIEYWDPQLRANYVRLFRKGSEQLSPSSKLYLMGFEADLSRGQGCSGAKKEIRMKFEPDTRVCGYNDDETIVCATSDTNLAPYCEGLQCSGFLIEKQHTFLGRGGFRLLAGLPIPSKGPSSKNARAFIRVSNYTDWIMERTEGAAILYNF